jgi:hypothetical protein
MDPILPNGTFVYNSTLPPPAFSPETILFGGIGALFAGLAIFASSFLIIAHLRFYTNPNHQRYIIRILMMVPVYSIYSVLSLFFWEQRVFLALLRDSYEAYVMYQFFALCLQYGGGFDALGDRISSQPPFALAFPFNFIRAQPGRYSLATFGFAHRSAGAFFETVNAACFSTS